MKDDDWTFGWLTHIYVACLYTCLRSLQYLLWKLAEVRALKTRSLMPVLFHVYATADQSLRTITILILLCHDFKIIFLIDLLILFLLSFFILLHCSHYVISSYLFI